MLDAKLIIISPDVQPKEFKLSLPTTIGRSRQATIKLAHALVSRIHCELFEADGQLMVRDLGSLNGTFVNDKQVTEGSVAPNDTLTVGTVTFRAMYGGVDPRAKTKTLGTTMAAKAAAAATTDGAVAAAKPQVEPESLDELWTLDDDEDISNSKETPAPGQTINKSSPGQASSPAPPKSAPVRPASKDEDDDVLEWLKDDEESPP